MQNLDIHKIGGSVLQNPQETKKIFNQLVYTPQRHIIIISAIYGVTNLLEQYTEQIADIDASIKKVRNIHNYWILTLVKDQEKSENALLKIEKELATLKLNISSYHRTPNPYLKAKILSSGERLAAIIIHGILSQTKKCDLQYPENIGLSTNDNPLNAEFIAINENKLQQVLTRHKIVIVPGFYGTNKQGENCLVGRGGSDYTAAYLASHLNAQRLIFWKDTVGVLSADPKYIKNAKSIANLNINALGLMERIGAAIIHPKVTEQIRDTGIEICFFNPLIKTNPVTTIDDSKRITESPIIITRGDKSIKNNFSDTEIIILSRNMANAYMVFSRWKYANPGSQIISYSNYHLQIKVPEGLMVEAANFFHNSFYPDPPLNEVKKPQTAIS